MPRVANYSWLHAGFQMPEVCDHEVQAVLSDQASPEDICARLEDTDKLHLILINDVWDYLNKGGSTEKDENLPKPSLFPGSRREYQVFNRLCARPLSTSSVSSFVHPLRARDRLGCNARRRAD